MFIGVLLLVAKGAALDEIDLDMVRLNPRSPATSRHSPTLFLSHTHNSIARSGQVGPRHHVPGLLLLHWLLHLAERLSVLDAAEQRLQVGCT